jgi:undecaprenyl-phosphate 4-deoxy-4-formamido-L-arabinose transferase
METAISKSAFISVVVPVYNSEAILPLLVDRLKPVLNSIVERWEVILVNDASRDGSWQMIQHLAESEPRARGIDFMRNYGQHNAVLCGVRAAKGDVVVTMDDDLQHPPEEIPALLSRLEEGYDVVYGTPLKEQHGLLRDLASSITKLALRRIMGAATAQSVSAFRVLRTPVRDAFANYQGAQVSLDVLLTWGTGRFSAVRVRHDPRKEGDSNYTIGKLITVALNLLTGFSTLPLRIASIVGFAFTLFGIGILCYVLARYLAEGGSVPGFPFLASLTAIFSGAQLFALGILGEYLARMYVRTMDRPTYAVRSTTECDLTPMSRTTQGAQ